MIQDCYIIREYLPNGTVSDNGYYEEAEMLEDLAEFQTGSNRFEVIPCTADDVKYGLNHLILTIYGKEAVDEANKCCDELFGNRFPVFAKNCVIIGESELILPLSYYDDVLDGAYSIDVFVNQNCCDDALAWLHDSGFATMWCSVQIKHSDGSVEIGAFFQI